MARQQSSGKCDLCKGTFSKATMTRHLAKCRTTHEPLQGVDKAKKDKLFHVLVEGKYNPQYWLHLEMTANSRLGDLDRLLRNIWLECCGHMSAFTIRAKRKQQTAMNLLDALAGAESMDWADPNELDMETKVSNIFTKGLELSYDYDFGSTTTLCIKVLGEREGLPLKASDIAVLARNDPPYISCGMCHKAAATLIDMESSYDESGWLCDGCAKKSELVDSEMTLPVVNSPRTGVCAYTGN